MEQPGRHTGGRPFTEVRSRGKEGRADGLKPCKQPFDAFRQHLHRQRQRDRQTRKMALLLAALWGRLR